jgi:ubiquinone/menaquinone biosynthesis C-methylase UbiE
VVETPSLTRLAYRAQEAFVRLPLVAAHLGLRPFSRRAETPGPSDVKALRRRHRELIERDYRNAEAGLYPKRLLFQMPVREYLRDAPALVREIARMMGRARRGRVRELPNDVDLGRYPDYFRRNFHWQTDGYLSERSAAVYDAGVEFLFFGTADVMRRQVIPPITEFLERDRRARGPGPRRILDVAAGTGRTLLQLAAAHPHERYTALDLSPYYVKHAERVLAEVSDVSFVIENAEQLSFRDAEFDVVTSTYLFHELPERARRNVLGEMKRTLRPGGRLVIEDAAQLAESAELRVFLENFALGMNEPFFANYIATPLEELIREAGFVDVRTTTAFLSKVVVAEAP